MNDYEQQLEQKKNRVLVENNAQTIFDHLTELTNLGGIHERRWLWELLQNAKDSIEDTKTVSVEVEFQDEHLLFNHNGTPFVNDEIIHLIYHGSTKKGFLDKTGKFGTGFLTTHLLSKKVLVSGITDDGRGFNFTLDRSGKNPKEVETAMESSWVEFKKSQASSTQNGFTTTYCYTLDDQSRSIAKKGLHDLPRLLPFVLAFNPKLESFTLKTSDTSTIFRRAPSKSVNHEWIEIVTIETTNQAQETSQHILALARENRTAVAIPLVDSSLSITIKSLETDVPRLFFDFPLFGTEDFSFPAIINSSDFIPKSERDGIYLGDKTSEEIISNKKIIEDACRLYLGLVNYACSEQWRDLYQLAPINPPINKDWLDSAWYEETLQKLQNAIIEKDIVMTEQREYVSPQNALFPIEIPVAELWEFASPLFPKKLPASIHVDSWIDILKSWGNLLGKSIEEFDNALTFDKLCQTISESMTLEVFKESLQSMGGGDEIVWLNKLFLLLTQQGKKSLFESYSIIPNQNGILKKKTLTLFLDDGIDEAIKDISIAIGDDLRDRLVLCSISLDNTLLATKTQEEVLSATLSSLKLEAAKNYQDSPLHRPVIDILVWLVQHQRADLLSDIPVVTRNDSAILFSKLSTTTRLLVPPELWQEIPNEYSELFPPDFMMSSEYYEKLTIADWDFLYRNEFIYSEPIFEELTRLDYQIIFSEDTEQKEHQLDPIMCSKIAYLDQPKDKGIIDRIRRSKPRSILFFKFLLSCVLDRDTRWQQSAQVACECGSSHSVFPSHWFYYTKSRKWVPLANNGSVLPSAQSLAALLEREQTIISKLKEDKSALFLNRIGIGVGELLRNIVTGGDDTKKLEWDKAFGAILTSGQNPSQLIAEFEERERNREKVLANQELGRKIESIFAATFSSDEFKALGFNVERTGIGSDYEVEYDFIDGNEEQLLNLKASHSETLVEIKSTAKTSCTMTSTQGKKAVDHCTSFCLCVVPLTGVEITDDIIRTNARFVTNIGELLKPKVSHASSLQDLRDEAVSTGGDIEIDISESQIRYRVNQTVWQSGKTFNEFVSFLMSS
jgi:hypothetical protein